MVQYLLNDKQQDSHCTNVSLRFLLLIILNVWIGQVKFDTELNCTIFTHSMQNNLPFKLFKL